jgi:hypothetical protein
MSKSSGNILYYFTLGMTALYALLGIYIMLSAGIENFLPGYKKYTIGILLILYSFYRAYRIWKINKSMMENNHDDQQ